MDKHVLRDLYTKETGNSFIDDVAKYADWLEEKITGSQKLLGKPTLKRRMEINIRLEI